MSKVKEHFGVLHEMPEVGHKEYNTAAYLAEKLTSAGYIVSTGVGGTGVVGIIDGQQAGPVVVIRADMDALSHLIDGQECAIHSLSISSHDSIDR